MYNTTAVGQRREDGNRCKTFCVVLWMLQNTPTKSTSISAVRLTKLYLDVRTFALYGADTPKQDAVSFIGRLTLSSMTR